MHIDSGDPCFYTGSASVALVTGTLGYRVSPPNPEASCLEIISFNKFSPCTPSRGPGAQCTGSASVAATGTLGYRVSPHNHDKGAR